MKEAEKIIKRCEAWSEEDKCNRAATVVMVDKKEDKVYVHFAGTSRDVAELVSTLMDADAEFGRAIYVSACLYAHENIEKEERDKIIAVSSAITEARKEMKGTGNEQ